MVFTETAGGEIVPRRVEAVGGVKAITDTETLIAGAFSADVVELTGEDGGTTYELANVVGQDGVEVVRRPDGAEEGDELRAVSDVLLGRGSGDSREWRLTGLEGAPVELRRGADVLTVSSITYAPATGEATLPGAGTATLMIPPPGGGGAADDGQGQAVAEVPLAVEWQGGARAFKDGRVEIRGPLTAESRERTEQGLSVLTAEAESAEIVPMPEGEGDDGSELGGAQELVLRGAVDVNAVLTDDAGDLLRRVHLLGPIVKFDARRQALSVPAAGEMLYQDFRPAVEQDADADRTDFGSFRGTAGLRWDGSLSAELEGEGIQVRGNVQLASRRSDGPDGGEGPERLKVVAEELDATLRKTGENAAELVTGSARGDVDFTSDEIAFTAGTIDYVAATRLLTATGGANRPIELSGRGGADRGQVGRLVFDVGASQIVEMKDITGRTSAGPR